MQRNYCAVSWTNAISEVLIVPKGTYAPIICPFFFFHESPYDLHMLLWLNVRCQDVHGFSIICKLEDGLPWCPQMLMEVCGSWKREKLSSGVTGVSTSVATMKKVNYWEIKTWACYFQATCTALYCTTIKCFSCLYNTLQALVLYTVLSCLKYACFCLCWDYELLGYFRPMHYCWCINRGRSTSASSCSRTRLIIEEFAGV